MHKVDYINKIIEFDPEYKNHMWRLWDFSIKSLKKLFNKLQKEALDAKNNN